MIYIVSTTNIEFSTDRVIDWLHFRNANYKRINGEDFGEYANLEISIDNIHSDIFVNDTKLNVVNIAWYRRWGNTNKYNNFNQLKLSYEQYDSIMDVVIRDNNVIKNFVLNKIEPKKWLTDPKLSTLNKLKTLSIAASINLKIPLTKVLTRKDNLLLFLEKSKKLIVKSISETTAFEDSKNNYSFLTEVIDDTNIDSIPIFFVPSLFQECIDKKFEIRVFYLDGEFYSMAIFSQNDKTTKNDFRNYNHEKPNRNVPVLLPVEIENKLDQLMKKLNLNCGSIDLILTNKNEYIFLEINPVGQFGMVSKPCNYFLEKKVADFLIKNDN